MEVFTEVKVNKYSQDNSNNGNLLGFARVTVANAIVLTGIKILKSDGGNFIGMPQRMFEKDGEIKYKEIFYPLCKEVRKKLQKVIISEYNKVVAGGQK